MLIVDCEHIQSCIRLNWDLLGLLLGTEALVMTPNGIDFSISFRVHWDLADL